MKKKRKIRETTLFTMIMLMLTLAIGASSWVRARSIGKLSYLEHLDDTIVTVDGTDYKCRNLAFYLAYQEMTTEEQAKVYDLEQTDKYWNAHANGSFLRLEAKDQAMDMADFAPVYCACSTPCIDASPKRTGTSRCRLPCSRSASG